MHFWCKDNFQFIEIERKFDSGCNCSQLQVRVALYKNNVEVHSLKFSADKDNVKWFSQENLIFSSWVDLSNHTSPMRMFALKPEDTNSKRSFEISKEYKTCPHDRGWLLITTVNNPCDFEKHSNLSIIYSNQKEVTVYDKRGK